MKTANLTGAELDYWAAKAEGFTLIRCVGEGANEPPIWHPTELDEDGEPLLFAPSRDWNTGGPIIDREIKDMHCDGGKFKAIAHDGSCGWGATYLEAAMRAYVCSKFGDEASDDGSLPCGD